MLLAMGSMSKAQQTFDYTYTVPSLTSYFGEFGAASMAKTPQGGIAFTASENVTGPGQFFTQIIDTTGSLIESNSFQLFNAPATGLFPGATERGQLQPHADGGYISSLTYNYDLAFPIAEGVIKYDSAMQVQWCKFFYEEATGEYECYLRTLSSIPPSTTTNRIATGESKRATLPMKRRRALSIRDTVVDFAPRSQAHVAICNSGYTRA